MVTDTTNPASPAAAADEVFDRHPDLNGLVAMAGSMQPESPLDPAFLAAPEPDRPAPPRPDDAD
ncbi:hypothetical protein O7628_22680 [Micromonospora sp. WMMD956]|uniref:hypothetical protein n=1 Tax=Micromonospora sp. WMMD956 TaxID=3016108 RepID=UPI002416CAB4|nr:hypothetical protein [Micromonospora sp. WMMD956]MDG4818292.1 hypothetical protein [Micromonospora sp. WMMD956]